MEIPLQPLLEVQKKTIPYLDIHDMFVTEAIILLSDSKEQQTPKCSVVD